MEFSNKAIATPIHEIETAKVFFCYSPRAVSHGQVFLCKLARGTLKGYTGIMKKYVFHMMEEDIPLYPASDVLWAAVMDFMPSHSMSMLIKAKACWLLYCEINEQTMPNFVRGYFDGLRRLKVPIKLPSRGCTMVSIEDFQIAIMSITNIATEPKDFMVLVSMLCAAFAGFRLGDSVRLVKSSFVLLPRGYRVTHNTKKVKIVMFSCSQAF